MNWASRRICFLFYFNVKRKLKADPWVTDFDQWKSEKSIKFIYIYGNEWMKLVGVDSKFDNEKRFEHRFKIHTRHSLRISYKYWNIIEKSIKRHEKVLLLSYRRLNSKFNWDIKIYLEFFIFPKSIFEIIAAWYSLYITHYYFLYLLNRTLYNSLTIPF